MIRQIATSYGCAIAILAAVTVVHADAKPTSASAVIDPARKSITAAVAAVIGDLGGKDFRKREQAQRTLQALNEAVMAEVLSKIDKSDPEQVARVVKLLRQQTRTGRLQAMMLSLSPKQRGAVAGLAKSKPDSLDALFSDSPNEVAGAVNDLGKTGDLGAELALCWALRRELWVVRMAVYRAMPNIAKPTSAIRDAILIRFEEVCKDAADSQNFSGFRHEDWQRYHLIQQTRSRETVALVGVLAQVADARALPHLLTIVVGEQQGVSIYGKSMGHVQSAVVRIRDKRTVPTLMSRITSKRHTHTTGGHPKVKTTSGDRAMAIIIQQTGQSLSDYGFRSPRSAKRREGFVKDADRKAAQKKLQAWWAKHRNEYKDVKPIPIGRGARGRHGAVPEIIHRLGKH